MSPAHLLEENSQFQDVPHDSFDTHVGVVEQSCEKLGGQVPGHVNEEVVKNGRLSSSR
jgi:hypothetical protein